MARRPDRKKTEPVHRPGPVWVNGSNREVAVWAKDSDDRTLHGVSFHRSYKDDKEEWRRTASLFPEHLSPLAKLLEEAWPWIAVQRRSLSRSGSHGPSARDGWRPVCPCRVLHSHSSPAGFARSGKPAEAGVGMDSERRLKERPLSEGALFDCN